MEKFMNFKSIGFGIALTCGTLAVGSTLAPAQAATIVGTANFSGLLSFANESLTNPTTETLQFTNPGGVLSATGIFASSTDVTIGSGDPYSLQLTKIANISTNSASYSITSPVTPASPISPFLTFNNGIEFQATSIGNIVRRTINTSDGVITGVDAFSIIGNFYNGATAIGSGSLTAQQINSPGGTASGSYSYSIQAQSVPEPFTILGSVTALGMGAALKKKQAQKQIQEKVTA